MASGAAQNSSQMACDSEIPGFLDAFLQDFPAPLSLESPLPWKVPGTVLSQEEVEAELIELALGFLGSRNAPPSFAVAVTHEAISQLLQTDLSEFKRLPEQEEEEEEEEEEKALVTCLSLESHGRQLGLVSSTWCDSLKMDLATSLSSPGPLPKAQLAAEPFIDWKLDRSQIWDITDVAVLDAKGLARSFFNCLWKVCSQWQKQVPLTAQAPQWQWLVSIHAIRNTRRKMEDRHVSLPAFNHLFSLSDSVHRAYFAVFDGHGGVDAARYASVHVHTNASHQPELRTNPAAALKEAFRLTDEMFLQKAKRERLQSGTTGVCALIAGAALHVAWLGDSQVILVQQGRVVKLMEPHKPERQDEKARIEALGGFVSLMDCWRVNGTLAVSRAIGDVFQKPYVSGEADAASRELTGSEDYLLLACDGFFDVVPHHEVTGLVHGHLLRHKGNGMRIAEELVAVARDRGSHDNITVMVVFLGVLF